MTGVRTRPSTPVRCECGMNHQHGTRRMYALHLCGCFACRVANANAVHTYRRGGSVVERKIDSTGTRRRLRALAAAGVSARRVAAMLGVSKEAVQELRSDRSGSLVFVTTAARVAAVYERLWDAPTGDGYSERTRREALAKGWAPPLAWDDIDDPAAEPFRDRYVTAADRDIDEVAVAEAIRGRAVHLTSDERAEAVLRMTERGYSAAVIAERLHTTQRAVTRRRSRGIRGAA